MDNKVKNYKKIDFENHFYDISLTDALRKRDVPPYFRDETNSITWTDSIIMPQGRRMAELLDFEARLELMDKVGIDVAIVSASPGTEQLDDAASKSVSRATNDALYAVTKKYNGRFLGSATLPVNDAEAACAELERCVKDLGFVAWHTHSNYGKTAPENERYRSIFKKAAELGVYVYLHPQLPDQPRLSDYGFVLAGAGLGFTQDAMTTITRIIISGLLDEIPNLTIVLGHLGEAMPYLLERMDMVMGNTGIPFPLKKSKHVPSYYFKNNILVTTSGNMSDAAFTCARMALGNDRILLGTDYPYQAVENMVEKMMLFIEDLPISDEEKEQVFWKNANDKLGITCGE